MSSIIATIKKRRSVRKYSPKSVPPLIIRDLLESAKWAPSAHNSQPWRFIVLLERASKVSVAKAMANAWKIDLTSDGVSMKAQNALVKTSIERFADPPVLILACLTMEDMIAYPDEKRQKCERDLAMQSLGAAIQNILLGATAKKLSTCWYSAPAFSKEAVRAALSIPQNIEPQAIIAVGYPAEKPAAKKRKPLESYAFKEAWNNTL